MKWMIPTSLAMTAMFGAGTASAQVSGAQIDAAAGKVAAKVISWRRDIHQHPELSNRETRTSKLVADHLKKLGLPVRTGIAHTGVTAVLKGGKPGPVIALRADMDALPVSEQVDVPFKSTVTTEYLGKKVGVMHACGHDSHVANLMGVAEMLVSMKQELPGTVLFIFQPAEEGAPEGEQGGASLMIKEGVFSEVKPEAVFGLHVTSTLNSGTLGYRSGPFMAASDSFRIEVQGRQSHGSRPWSGVDPIVASSQIVMGLQTIVSRQIDITELPAVVTIGKFDGGVRHNIIPDKVEMFGTLRTFDKDMRADIMKRIDHTASNIAQATGAQAKVVFNPGNNPVVMNNAQLTQRALPSLKRVAGDDKVVNLPLITGSEDFAYYADLIPSLFFYVGVTPPGQDANAAPSNHSPLFYIDEPGIAFATRALASVAIDYLQGSK
ncbi:amidohydrolase [Steroidobacter cummioxidans]|uniref:amidohydrolase n=1 Tax=Steroidobacter cummioxidans TaxID=1803913 RepID=UPI0014751425|nr:amidohydrolase [Steroidobacter cummioxidans]